MTITEALADIKTINDRIAKKRHHSTGYILRESRVVDPHASNGGSEAYVSQEWQAISDLELRIVALRGAIQRVNHATMLTVSNVTKSVADWLTWRREIYKPRIAYLEGVHSAIQRARDQWKPTRAANVPQGAEDAKLIVNVNEPALLAEIEQMQQMFNELDGKLSLINATTTVHV